MWVNNKVLFQSYVCLWATVVNYQVKQKRRRVLSAFHATPINVPITTHNGFASDLLKWALIIKSRFYATWPWFLYIILAKSQDVIVNLIKTILRKFVLTSIKTLQRNDLTNYPFSRVPFFPFLFPNPKLIILFREKKTIAASVSALYSLKPFRPRTRTSFHVQVH